MKLTTTITTLTITGLTIETLKHHPLIVFIGIMASILLFLNQLYVCVQIINRKHKGNIFAYVKAFKIVKTWSRKIGRKSRSAM